MALCNCAKWGDFIEGVFIKVKVERQLQNREVLTWQDIKSETRASTFLAFITGRLSSYCLLKLVLGLWKPITFACLNVDMRMR